MRDMKDYFDDTIDVLPTLESFDGEDFDVEAEKKAMEIATHPPLERVEPSTPKEKFFKEVPYADQMQYFNNIDQGRKIAHIIGIIFIVLSAISAINSFFTGEFHVFIGAVMRIFAAIQFMRGKNVWRTVMIIFIAIASYSPFVALFLSPSNATYQDIFYAAALLLYCAMEVVIIKSETLQTFFSQ